MQTLLLVLFFLVAAAGCSGSAKDKFHGDALEIDDRHAQLSELAAHDIRVHPGRNAYDRVDDPAPNAPEHAARSFVEQAAKTGGGERSVRTVWLANCERQDVPTVLDLASGRMLDAPVGEKAKIIGHFNRLDRGDLAWDGELITLRGARLSVRGDGVWQIAEPERNIDGCSIYRLQSLEHVQVTTAEGGSYIAQIQADTEGAAIVSYYHAATPPEATANGPGAMSPAEGTPNPKLTTKRGR